MPARRTARIVLALTLLASPFALAQTVAQPPGGMRAASPAAGAHVAPTPAQPAPAAAPAPAGGSPPTVLGRSYPPPLPPPVAVVEEPSVYVGVVSPRDRQNGRLGGARRGSGSGFSGGGMGSAPAADVR